MVLPEKEEAPQNDGSHDPNEVVPVSSVFIDLGDVDEESGEIKVMEFNKFKKLVLLLNCPSQLPTYFLVSGE